MILSVGITDWFLVGSLLEEKRFPESLDDRHRDLSPQKEHSLSQPQSG